MTYKLTPNELKAAMIFVRSCFGGMGGERPSDLADDEYTWVELSDLTYHGYSKHEAAGTISALLDKGILEGEMVTGRPTEMNMTNSAWRWLDTLWDDYSFDEKEIDYEVITRISCYHRQVIRANCPERAQEIADERYELDGDAGVELYDQSDRTIYSVEKNDD